MSYIKTLYKEQAFESPPWMAEAVQLEVIAGSMAYGVSSDNSDMDMYAITIPPKRIVFPYQGTETIYGFGKKPQNFDVWQKHHIQHPKFPNREFDISCYSIVKYFQLAMENNPNILDALFVPQRCVTYQSEIGQYIRINRKNFLHKGSYYKTKGYAFSQLNKLTNRNYTNSKRKDTIAKFGYDVKHAYHVVRLINQAEYILVHGDLDIEDSREQLKSIRRGDWSLEQIKEYFQRKEKQLDELYHKSTALPYKPVELTIKNMLVNCLEMYYGSITEAVKEQKTNERRLLHEISAILRNGGY